MEVAKILNDRRQRAGKLTAEEVRFANERLAGLREKEFWRTVLDESLYGFVALCVAVTLGLGALAGPLVGLGVGGWLFWHPFRAGSADEA